MRETPFSVSLEQAIGLKELSELGQEMSALILKALKTDKRSLRCDADKAIFKAKLEKYCTLYKQTREKYLLVAKKEGKSTNYKEPVPFERLVRDFNWQKTVTYSKPIKRHEEDEDHLVGILTDDDIIITKNEIEMSSIFNRKDPIVIENANSLSIEEFVEMYSQTTASRETLEKAYHAIKGTKAEDAITERTGNEGSSDVLGAKTTTPKKVKYKVDQMVQFSFAGSKLIGKILSEDPTDKFQIEGPDGTKYPVNISDIIGEAKAKSTPTTEKPKAEAAPAAESTGDEKPSFKALDKQVKLDMIQKLYDAGATTTALVKAKLAETYTIGHYDDVYNVFIKIKK